VIEILRKKPTYKMTASSSVTRSAAVYRAKYELWWKLTHRYMKMEPHARRKIITHNNSIATRIRHKLEPTSNNFRPGSTGSNFSPLPNLLCCFCQARHSLVPPLNKIQV